jgi:hypothetical protein
MAPPARQPVASKELLGLFWNLADVEPQVRIDAAAALVAHVRAAQARAPPAAAAAAAKPARAGAGAAAEPCAELEYAAQRLVRGLSSSRDCARQGFALALAAALRELPELTTERVLSLVDDTLGGAPKGAGAAAGAHGGGGGGGGEAVARGGANAGGKADEREQAIGCLFALAALVRSGRVEAAAATASAPATATAAAASAAPRALAALARVAERRWFLAEPAMVVAAELVERCCAAGGAATSLELLPHFAAALGGRPPRGAPLQELPADRLLLLLRGSRALLAAGLAPAALAAALPSLPVDAATGCVLGGVARAGAASPLLLDALKASSSAHPRLHAVWPALLDALAPRAHAAPGADAPPFKKRGREKPPPAAAAELTAAPAGLNVGGARLNVGGVHALWRTVVDEGLLGAPSAERKYLALLVRGGSTLRVRPPSAPPSAWPPAACRPWPSCLCLGLSLCVWSVLSLCLSVC